MGEFGYPEFDSSGEKILTTYDNEYSNMLMDIRVFKLNKGEIKHINKYYEEFAVLLLRGKVVFKWETQERLVNRIDVFSEGLWCLHVCKDVEVILIAEEDSKILIQATKNEKRFQSKLYGPDDAPWVYVCKDKLGNTAGRRVSTVFDYKTAPYSNMVLGEVINDPGNWSGYIPHHHPQPETYYFMFDRPEGFGASFVGDDVYKIEYGSFSAIPGGKTHPQVSAPGYQMYTCWMIRHLEGNPWIDRIDDVRYKWLLDSEL